MVNRHAAFLHDFFKAPIAQGISRVPADADQKHVDQNRIPLVFSMAACSISSDNRLPDSRGRLAECDITGTGEPGWPERTQSRHTILSRHQNASDFR
jgi:hypothetical protein